MFQNTHITDTGCPLCEGGYDICETGTPQVDGSDFWVENECTSCHQVWKDVYNATAYSPACPSCASSNVEGGRPQVDGPNGWVGCWCNDCGAEWQDYYEYAYSEEIPY